MNITFSLEQKFRTRNVDANLLLRQHKLDLMARILEIESVNQKMKQRELGYPSFTLQRYSFDIKTRSH